jgi:hypothetical protein
MELDEFLKRISPRAVYSSIRRGGGSEKFQICMRISGGRLGKQEKEADIEEGAVGVPAISRRQSEIILSK